MMRSVTLPPGYAPDIAALVWALEDGRERTKRAVKGLDAAALDWQPGRGRNSIGTLLYHIAAIEMSYLYEDILECGWIPELEPLLPYPVRVDGGSLSPVRGEPLHVSLQRLDQTRARLLDTLRTMTAGEWRRPRIVEQTAVTPEWAVYHLIQHEAQHRGQILELRREASTLTHGPDVAEG